VETNSPRKVTPTSILAIVLVAVVFGALMGFSTDAPNRWLRAGVSGVAFALLGWFVSYMASKAQVTEIASCTIERQESPDWFLLAFYGWYDVLSYRR